VLYRFRRGARAARFNRRIAGILDTPPLRMRGADWTFVSMVANRDVQMYLLAIKSLYARMGGGGVVAIVHADLPAASRALLAHHLPQAEIIVGDTLDPGACQRGGTWERLVHILDRARDGYVIQLDADVLAFGADVAEVLDCARRNIPFALGDGTPMMGMVEAARRAQSTRGDYIGDAAERLFDRYPNAAALRYVHGSSGFAGFARGGFQRPRIEAFHATMEGMLGARWREWGTEQVGSNFAIANSPGGVVLPYPAYASFPPNGPPGEAKLLHFIGTYRFDGGVFAQRGCQVIASLRPG
jgi:hypothetical protein